MKLLLCVLFLFFSLSSRAQYASVNAFLTNTPASHAGAPFGYTQFSSARKLFQHNTGMILGLQRGANTAIELGGEAHWRKLSLLKPHIIGATANLEYNMSNHIIGYKAGMWMKRGRINLTYGGNIGYYNDFKKNSRLSFGPSVGFRLLGFHLINGYNFLTRDKSTEKEDAVPVNSMYMSLRYYFPVQNRFTWDRKTMRKKRERKKERAKRKKERQKEEKKGVRKLLNL